ncbi:helix-turn-helix transcriptional regulator [Phycicoccus flavus]|uniref:helix-turn-helix transcriptional regulator n=1 Tax=Phycicoccus flavus TaxID=2502783 RepID=UPI000FEBCF07|nr:response regulator transcription factor [Phycicoccus flavus]NHA69095.1 helix-turn-helix domain-containing protein [Phycicoccus flavus]
MTRQGTTSPAQDLRAFYDAVWDLMAEKDPRVRPVGHYSGIDVSIAERVARAERSTWNMQRNTSLRAWRSGLELGRGRERPPADHRIVLDTASVLTAPVLASVVPQPLVTDVPLPLFVTDRSHVFLAGADGTPDAYTVWESEHPDVVDAATEAYLGVWRVAVPASDVVDRPRLSAPLVEVAFLLLDGSSDQEIAQRLGTSERTASNHVRRLVDWADAGSRGRLIALLAGGET